MQKYFWVFLSLFFVVVLFFTIRFGIRPKPQAQINPTTFSEMKEIGAVVYRRLFSVFRKERLVVLGTNPLLPESEEIWRGLFLTAKSDRQAWDILLQEPELKAIRPTQGMKVIPASWSREPEKWLPKIRQWLEEGQSVVIHSVTSMTSQTAQEAAIHVLEKGLGRPVFTISLLPFAVNEQQASLLQPPCPEDKQGQGQAPLGCAAQRVSQKFFRKELSKDELIAVMEKHGVMDYLLFVHRPKSFQSQ